MVAARDNPFAVHRVLAQRYRFDAAAWGNFLARLEKLGWRGALVGPQGSGKTTLLEDLAAQHGEGRLPLLHRCETSPVLLGELVRSLSVTLSLADAVALHARHGGNLRAALRELYDVHADAAAIPGFPSPALPPHCSSPWTLTNVRDN